MPDIQETPDLDRPLAEEGEATSYWEWLPPDIQEKIILIERHRLAQALIKAVEGYTLDRYDVHHFDTCNMSWAKFRRRAFGAAKRAIGKPVPTTPLKFYGAGYYRAGYTNDRGGHYAVGYESFADAVLRAKRDKVDEVLADDVPALLRRLRVPAWLLPWSFFERHGFHEGADPALRNEPTTPPPYLRRHREGCDEPPLGRKGCWLRYGGKGDDHDASASNKSFTMGELAWRRQRVTRCVDGLIDITRSEYEMSELAMAPLPTTKALWCRFEKSYCAPPVEWAWFEMPRDDNPLWLCPYDNRRQLMPGWLPYGCNGFPEREGFHNSPYVMRERDDPERRRKCGVNTGAEG